MQCNHAQEFFSEYVTGDMDRALVIPLENHLASCSECRETVDGLRSVWATLDAMPLVEPPSNLHANLMQRIATEQTIQERDLILPRRKFAWRGMFQARNLAYAAAALVLLVGVEWIQVQRAALGPLGWISTTTPRPTPLLETSRVQWMPDGQGGGTLSIRLQAHAHPDGSENRLRYQLQLVRKDGQGDPALRQAVRTGVITSQQPTIVSLPLSITPNDGVNTLSVILTNAEGTGENETVAIPLSPAP